ncbi:peroxisomal leader peptide-processing protease-like [Ciona intestinalis]
MIERLSLHSACAVTVESKGENGTEPILLTFSGTLLQQGNMNYVLTHFSPLVQFMACQDIKPLPEQNYWVPCNNDDYNVFIQCEAKAAPSPLRKLQTKPLLAWNASKFEEVLDRILASANVPYAGKDDITCCTVHKDNTFLSWFLLLEVKHTNLVAQPKYKFGRSLRSVYQGMEVSTTSFPFGAETLGTFGGCVSTGIICNVVEDKLMIIDARVLPGSEGGAVISLNEEFIGIIVSPLVLKTGQLSGLSLVCEINEVLNSFQDVCNKNTVNSGVQFFHKTLGKRELCLEEKSGKINSGVVVLENNKGWGSGVVVAITYHNDNASIVIATCRHVVQPVADWGVRVQFYSGKNQVKRNGTVIYKSKVSWLDFALVKVDCDVTFSKHLIQDMNNLIKISDKCFVLKYETNYSKGVDVYATGHCLLEHHKNGPTITHGVLSNVLYLPQNAFNTFSKAVMLQTTCIVHDGASGGAVFSKLDNKLLGLIVNNVKEVFTEDRFTLYPDVNFILPAVLFMPLLCKYLLGKMNAFEYLDDLSESKEIQNVWFLGNSDENQKIASKL